VLRAATRGMDRELLPSLVPRQSPAPFLTAYVTFEPSGGSSPKCHVCRQENGVPDGHFIEMLE